MKKNAQKKDKELSSKQVKMFYAKTPALEIAKIKSSIIRPTIIFKLNN